MILLAKREPVNSTGLTQFDTDDLSTTISGESLVVTGLTLRGRRFLRREFGAIRATVAVELSPFDLATRAEAAGVQIDFDPFIENDRSDVA